MLVYRNTNFTKRNYEMTNVAACTIYDNGAQVPEGYEITEESKYFGTDEGTLVGMTPLWIEGGVRFWGWM